MSASKRPGRKMARRSVRWRLMEIEHDRIHRDEQRRRAARMFRKRKIKE